MKISSSTEHCYLFWPLRKLKEKLEKSVIELGKIPGDDILKVTHNLLKISQENSSISEEAMNCLALIGPLEFSSEQLNSDYSDPIEDHIDLILRKLVKILLNSQGEVSRVFCQTIGSILSHQLGQNYLKTMNDDKFRKFLTPLQKTPGKLSKSKMFNVNKFLKIVDKPELWSINDNRSHADWIIKLVTTMLRCFQEGSYYFLLGDACKLSLELSEYVFKFIFYDFLDIHNEEVSLVLSVRFNNLLSDQFENGDENPTYDSIQSLKVLLSVIEFLRLRGEPGNNSWKNNFLLSNINYSHCASAALSCNQYFSVITYCNIWCFNAGLTDNFGLGDEVFTGNLLEVVTNESRDGKKVLDMMFNASRSIGDKDAALGLGRFMIDNPQSRISHLLLEGKVEVAASLCESGVLSSQSIFSHGLTTSLYSMGLHHTLSQYLSSQPETPHMSQMKEYQQECFWRLEKWEQFCPENAQHSFSGCILGGLENAVRDNTPGLRQWKTLGLNVLSEEIQKSNLESSAEIYPLMSRLRQLSEMVMLGGETPTQESLITAVSDLQERDKLQSPNFVYLEPILTQRLILLKKTGAIGRQCLDAQTLHTSKMARQAKMFWVCNKLQKFYTKASFDVRLEEATVIYEQGQKEAGILLAKKLLNDVDLDDNNQSQIISEIFLNLGTWLHEQKAEANSKILEKYYLKAVSLLESNPKTCKGEDLIDAYMAVATLTDKLYTQTREFMNSSQYKERNEAIEYNKREAAILQKSVNKQKDLNVPRVIKERFCKLDVTEVAQYKSQLLDYLKMSLNYYLSVLSSGDRSHAVYRLISLWFSEGNHDLSEIGQILHDKLPSVSSHKIIPLLYQMAARMQLPSFSHQDFSCVLYNVMLRCTRDHPHHAVPIILALVR